MSTPAWDPASDIPYLAGPSSNSDAEPFSISSSIPGASAVMNADTISPTYNPLVNPPAPFQHKRKAMWHPQAGLFVSPNTTHIPKMEEYDTPRPNWSIPRLLPDDEIYMAFRPHIIRNSGDLFGRLNLNRSSLAKAILPVIGGYVLDAVVMESWIRLENALLDLSKSLLPKAGIPIMAYPKFPYEFGYRQSHRTRDVTLRCALRSRDAFIELSTLVSFILALNMDNRGSYEGAFYKLRARRHEPVHMAWLDLLRQSHVCDFSDNFRVGLVANPYTCHWAPQLYNFGMAHIPIWIFWGHHFKDTPFVHPIFDYFLPPDDFVQETITLATKASDLILPSYRFDPFVPPSIPAEEVAPDAFEFSPQSPVSYSPQSPMCVSPNPYDVLPPAFSPSTPPSPSSTGWAASAPSVPQRSMSSNNEAANAKALSALEEFFARQQEERTRRLSIENAKERQQRESREAFAGRHLLSKTSTVYQWIDQGDGNYSRVKVNSKQAALEWSNHTRNQRRFTGHKNEWDLCPQLSRYSTENPRDAEPYDSDDDTGSGSDGSDFVPLSKRKTGPASTALSIPDDGHTANTLMDLQVPIRLPATDVADPDALPSPQTEAFELVSILRDRFGYDLSSPVNWTSNDRPRRNSPAPSTSRSNRDKGKAKQAPKPNRNKGKAKEDHDDADVLSLSKAMMGLSFSKASAQPGVEEAVLHLVSTLSTTTWSFQHLPASFDYSTSSSAPLSLTSETLELHVIPSKEHVGSVFLIRNSNARFGTEPWMIATTDPSTVLLIYRKKWPSVDIIARELVQRGTKFNTAKAVTMRPQLTPLSNAPLGIRPKGYSPTREDYEEYVRHREDLLRGPKGRAALMHGGIIARIARDVVEHSVVLDGPILGDYVICEYGGFVLVDDQLTQTDRNTICGVYLAQTEQAPEGEKLVDGATLELSWWPQDSMWRQMSCFLRMEWTEMAEEYYQKRLQRLRRTGEDLEIKNASEWRKSLRKANTLTKKIEAGIEHYQGGYLAHCYREPHLDTAQS